jgi:hypothetical protein
MRRAIPLFHDKQELTMKTTLKTLSALALAAATLTAVTVATGSTASANPFRSPGHGPVALGGIHGVGLPFRGLGHGPVVPSGFRNGTISCFACNLPRPNPPHWGYFPGRFPHWGYFPGRFPRWGYFPRYGYNWWGYRYNRWYWEHYRDRYGFQGRPGQIALVGAPAVASAPAMASAPNQASAGPQDCLKEQQMPDLSVVFEDVCKQISAIAPPPSADPGRQAK